MRVFLTGTTGSIGSFLVPELINAGHQVAGLSCSDAGAEAFTRAGAEVFRGDVNDLARLHTAAEAADGVLHAAFNHDFSNLKQNNEDDRQVIETLGEVPAGRTGRSSSHRARVLPGQSQAAPHWRSTTSSVRRNYNPSRCATLRIKLAQKIGHTSPTQYKASNWSCAN
jgi:hypothetical protein